jgi:glycosyltransferase involved in cell wall biosynthesis
MASALPVVATRVGDVPELITDGVTGLLAGPDDEEGIARALERLIRGQELRERLGRAAREHIVANHSVQHLPEYLHSLYGGVLVHESASVAYR